MVLISIVSHVMGAVAPDCSLSDPPRSWSPFRSGCKMILFRADSLRTLHSAGPLAAPCQARMSHIQLFRNVDLWLAPALQSLVGLREGLEGKQGCLCTISPPNKAIVVQARSEGWQEPSAGKEEMFQAPSLMFLLPSESYLMSAAPQCEKLGETATQKTFGWSKFSFSGSGF